MAKTCRIKRIIRLHKSGMEDCRSGNLDSAAEKLNEALQEVRKIGLECYQARILNNLGIIWELKGQPDRARHHYQAALSMVSQKLDQSAEICKTFEANLGRVS